MLNSSSFICHPHYPPTVSPVSKVTDKGGKAVYLIKILLVRIT